MQLMNILPFLGTWYVVLIESCAVLFTPFTVMFTPSGVLCSDERQQIYVGGFPTSKFGPTRGGERKRKRFLVGRVALGYRFFVGICFGRSSTLYTSSSFFLST